ncbi:glycosyltransferase [Bradyrhizobium sp. B117]|uniref:glycosyltransferase n=1 Tax=Bradyrhizobium sp. B117 TaxID=3140246 RepID=UPI003183C200
MTLVSVYIPTRNRRLLLERAIASVRSQTHQDIEIIVVDDASSDDTHEYLRSMMNIEPRLVVFNQRVAGGAPRARNLAIRSARGQFITGLDDDDEFRPRRIEAFVNAWGSFASTRTACLFSDSVVTNGSSSAVTTDRRSQVEYRDLFRHNFIGNQVFCPTSRLVEIGGFDENLPAWQDLDLFMRLLKRYGVAQRTTDPSYIYHVERGLSRISMKVESRREAFERIVSKNFEEGSEQHQLLFLQLFSPFYGTVPSLSDWQRVLAWRAKPQVFARLLRATVRNFIKGGV